MSQHSELDISEHFESPLREADQLSNLSIEEKSQISAVVQRAMRESIDNKFKMRTIEGYLQKWTNLMKGYQRRYFYLDPSTGILQYYISKDQQSQTARGSISLDSATVINLSDDPMGFEVMAVSGDTYKLRASSSSELQNWISALKCSIELIAPNNSNMLANSIRGPSFCRKLNYKQSLPMNLGSSTSQDPAQEQRVIETVSNLEKIHDNLTRLLSTPELGPQSPLYKDVLTLKSLTNSSIESVYKCAYHIQQPTIVSKPVLPKKNSSNSLVGLFDGSLGNMHF
ncbi:Oxysterol-binding protein-related protein 11 [Oopsacas minuta]|uniref:Oxysterol-binding protein-related protein 11 n=1 Tax=Oopsacas minuta TaxID=111878 RepID=A0AAV7JTB2_9METZ|nr:Oxysterol-binding protein-related protein 11 [Oopsacas minuta]